MSIVDDETLRDHPLRASVTHTEKNFCGNTCGRGKLEAFVTSYVIKRVEKFR